MGTEEHTGREQLVLHPDRGPDADAAGHTAVRPHQAEAALQAILLPAGSTRVLRLDAGPAGNIGVGLAHCLEKAVKVAALSL